MIPLNEFYQKTNLKKKYSREYRVQNIYQSNQKNILSYHKTKVVLLLREYRSRETI